MMRFIALTVHVCRFTDFNILTDFLLIGLKQFTKDNFSLNISRSVCKLGFISDEELAVSDQVSADSALSTSCYSCRLFMNLSLSVLSLEHHLLLACLQ